MPRRLKERRARTTRTTYQSVLLSTGRTQRRGLELKVRWLGFDATHDTWEPVTNLATDVPDMVEAYLYSKRGDAVVRRALNRYFPAGGN